jgi:AraC family transcriptional regulator, transcriptional activator of pobA
LVLKWSIQGFIVGKQTMLKASIPQFGLYGESHKIEDPEFFHIEDIEYRSGDLGWKIQAHRHTHLFQILIITSGAVNVQLDDQQARLQGKWAILVPAGTVHSFEFSPKTDGRIISLAGPLLEDAHQGKAANLFKPLLNQADYIDFNKHEAQFSELIPLLNQLESELSYLHETRSLMGEYLIKAILLFLQRQQSHHKNAVNGQYKVGISPVDQLKSLIENHYKEHWSSQDYAQVLGTSVSRLNRLCKTAFGRSVMNLIHERMLLEAKRSLIYTARSVEEISYDLGFKDPGYFSRFFKRALGIPPGQFRALSNEEP